MKKTYINPTMDVVELKAQQLLAGSVLTISDDPFSGDAGARMFDLDLGLEKDPVQQAMDEMGLGLFQ